ncbi:hypothetical protein [Piscinibacter gummiphilus]|uniref:Uncharacterized protein n=1 Tax=Piscinibacter gummiphilus TaxID=946333 RepID=A0A1W6L5N6_9BURK|nr:hypothetical protein [Piscinibacter gummiphilus]ARN19639.1 hypothetical protein A4W93_06740 [Piscinibacter gummiphilus]ATU64309.1 hypothetical protein CPZ87_06825 [Piscinibacter gummiphilus]GLS93509.1 hypothetical protein GCM10007918_08000 [Piscinibacter gummiphilus]
MEALLWFYSAAPCAVIGVAPLLWLLWLLGNPEGRFQRWGQRLKARVEIDLQLARERRQAEQACDAEEELVRRIADTEMNRLAHLSHRNK